MPAPEVPAGLAAALLALGAALGAQDPPPAPDAPPPAAAEPAAAAPDGDAFALAFRWAESGSVGVTATAAREAGSASFAFDLAWAVEGERIRVRVDRLRVLEINGVVPEEPGFDVALATVAPALVPAVPFYVTRAGEFDGLVPREAAEEDVRRAAQGLGAGAADALLAALGDPARKLALETRAAESWAWWAAFWIDYATRPGESAAADVSLPSGLAGRPLAARLVQSCVDAHALGPVRAAHMRAETTFDGEDMLAVTLATLRRTSGAKVPDDALRSVSRIDRVDGVYLEDLRPLRVRWRKTIEVDDGKQASGRVEQELWSFAWPDVDPEFPAQLDHEE